LEFPGVAADWPQWEPGSGPKHSGRAAIP
jgi:hypothetical protein